MRRNIVEFFKELSNPLAVSLIISIVLYFYNLYENLELMVVNLCIKSLITIALVIILQEIGLIKGLPNIITHISKLLKYAKHN